MESKCRKTMRYKNVIVGLDISYVDSVSDVNPLVSLAEDQIDKGRCVLRQSLETSLH